MVEHDLWTLPWQIGAEYVIETGEIRCLMLLLGFGV
jgi:hypothetical protein